MRKDKLAKAVLGLFCGAILWKQYTLFQYFYSSKVDDIVVLALLLIIALLVSKRFINIKSRWTFSVSSWMLVIGIIITPLSYHTFQDVDLLGGSTYTFLLVSATALSGFSKKSLGLFRQIALDIIIISFGGYLQWIIAFEYLAVSLGLLFLFLQLSNVEYKKPRYYLPSLLVLATIAFSSFGSYQKKIILFPSQSKYFDKVVFADKTSFQTIDITEWKGQNWFYYNGINNFSTIDQWLYYEPLVHPAMHLAQSPKNVLVIGGDNGLAIKELIKYNSISSIDHLQIDPTLYQLAKSNKLFTDINSFSFKNQLVQSFKANIFRYLQESEANYDVIIVDIPDPSDIELNQYYTKEFYELCQKALGNKGILVTQAGSPYFATSAYYCIANTMKSAGLSILPMHNQVLTVGEWGWVMGSKGLTPNELKNQTRSLSFENISTIWLNNEAMNMMLSFGKRNASINDSLINTIKNPIVHSLYTTGNWNLN